MSRCGFVSRDGFRVPMPEVHCIDEKELEIKASEVYYVKLRPVEVGGGFPLMPKKRGKEERV